MRSRSSFPPFGVPDRRSFLRQFSLGAALFTARGLFAEELARTPAQTEGPFYPDKLPLDTDNDLLLLNDSITPAVGKVTYVHGRILDVQGRPVRGAAVEIWQCDGNGAYLHSESDNREKRDPHFQGFGRFVTGSTGEYLFRTIKPVAYPGRTPHIHYQVKRNGQKLLTTQCYVAGDPGNQRDGVWRAIGDEKARALVTVEFGPLQGSRIGELTARFDIVLGLTPGA